jgi:hypothetical protein
MNGNLRLLLLLVHDDHGSPKLQFCKASLSVPLASIEFVAAVHIHLYASQLRNWWSIEFKKNTQND